MTRPVGHSFWPLRRLRSGHRRAPVELLAAAPARDAAAEVLAPMLTGFERVSPALWVRDLSDDSRATLALGLRKGATFVVEFGVCCRWVPHPVAADWTWHRTAKQSRPDLWVDDVGQEHPISHLHGMGVLRRDAGRALSAVSPRAEEWWARVATPEGVLQEAARQAIEPSIHWPHPGIVEAFTQARLGHADRALEALSRVDLDPDDAATLRRLLAETTGRTTRRT